MAKKKRIRNFIKSTYNIKSWIGYKDIVSGAGVIKKAVSTLTDVNNTQKGYESESFQAAVTRMNLSEQEIKELEFGYYRNFLAFLVVGMIIAFYSIYRFYLGQWLSGWISMMMMICLFVFSMASHFWYFQICHRKLGCTFKEWYSHKIDR